MKIYWASLALLLMVTAFFSEGFYHYDEHWQILEFLNWKLGRNTDSSYLPWEYTAQIRPTIQPTLAEGFFRLWRLIFGEVNPFYFTTALRIISAGLFFTATYRLVKATLPLITKPLQKYFLFLIGFIWFLPFLYVRFSSESWSGSLFALGLSILLPTIITENKNLTSNPPPNRVLTKWHSLGAGVLLGLSFIFRYQSGIMFGGLFLWIWFYRCFKKNTNLTNFANSTNWRKNLLFISLGFSAVFLLSILIDRRFYGNWDLSVFQYFKTNLVEDKASEFGILPFDYYFEVFLRSYIPPISISLFFLVFGSYVKFRQSIFTWICLTFILIHILIPHKEIRFLLPITFYFPISAFLFYQFLEKKNKTIWNNFKNNTASKFGIKILKLILITSFLIINLQHLFYQAVTPLMAEINFEKTIYKTKDSMLFYIPFLPLPWSFYQRADYPQIKVNFPSTLNLDNQKANPLISQLQIDTLKKSYSSSLKKTNISTIFFLLKNSLNPKVATANKLTFINNLSTKRIANFKKWFFIFQLDFFNQINANHHSSENTYLYRINAEDLN